MTKIVKRDGHAEDFNPQKITTAILKAGRATGEFDEAIAKNLTLRVLNIAHQLIAEHALTVEEVQDIVEEVLLTSPYRKTAKAYILYRDQHAKIREITSRSQVGLVDQYLERLDWKVNENSNMSYSLQGLNNYISTEVTKIYWLNKIYPPEIREAHINGDVHIHDLGLLSVYCVGWDLQDLLTQGFHGASGKMESCPAKHFRTALGQIVNFFYTLQGEAAGAQAFSNFDTLLAPFIRYDNLGYKEVKQALQEFVFNVNVPTRVGFQTPFTNLTFDWICPADLR
ncbi:MAG TPA: anaerobic ribonucleoside-triphosphate reductase, partial [Candidatus Omnitrophota bacterium]|nr:anaerobic ribonucleoside-triphosphate reductase [Candidatus Omnitrophota bacterium]